MEWVLIGKMASTTCTIFLLFYLQNEYWAAPFDKNFKSLAYSLFSILFLVYFIIRSSFIILWLHFWWYIAYEFSFQLNHDAKS